MYIKGSFKASHIVTELMEDVWSKRHVFLSESKPNVLLSYRLSVSNYRDENDVNLNFYFHMVLSESHWWVTFSRDHLVNHDDLIFRETDENKDWENRVESYRRYAFSDLVRPMIQNKIDEAIAEIETRDDDVYIWDTLPIENFNGKV